MDNFWLEKARKYIVEHNAFTDVSAISMQDTSAIIKASVQVSLPSKFITEGVTPFGVKNKEQVQFVFYEQFPLVAPTILLRDDFPRNFPHITPSNFQVSPCIYYGDPSELLQQSEWMNGILNQLVDWLEKAASDDLLNYDQGWEPMRNDYPSGFVLYSPEEILDPLEQKPNTYLKKEVYYKKVNNLLLVENLKSSQNKLTHALYFITYKVISDYVPNCITNVSQLYEYANSIGINDIKAKIEKHDFEYIKEDKLFITLLVRRPVNLIGSDLNVEFLNFIIDKSDHRTNKGKEKKRILPNCKVSMLSHISEQSPALLNQLSGVNIKNNRKNITLAGCGSLGSKIGIHLARNGNEPFLCIDPDTFMPHNNARHALTDPYILYNKADILAHSIGLIGNISTKAEMKSALNVDYSDSRIVIDTTASLSVRNFLMADTNLPPIISCSLYGQGRYGLLLSENKSKSTRLADIWAHLYHLTLTNNDLRETLFSSKISNVRIGQSCSSQTMIVDDARISLMAATMSLKIQSSLSQELPQDGEVLFCKYDDNYSLVTESLPVPGYIKVESSQKRDWDVYLSKPTYDQMQELMRYKDPKETGGVLVGSVFSYAKLVIVTGILPAPPDSIEEVHRFKLGKIGLEGSIKKLEKKTNGKVTYLGTWHSHPQGGSASTTDYNTYEKLLFIRNYEPTICLIITKDGVVLV